MSQARNGEENVLDITYDLQLHKVTSDGLCVDLTLISPCIPLLYVLDLKDPFILARIVMSCSIRRELLYYCGEPGDLKHELYPLSSKLETRRPSHPT